MSETTFYKEKKKHRVDWMFLSAMVMVLFSITVVGCSQERLEDSQGFWRYIKNTQPAEEDSQERFESSQGPGSTPEPEGFAIYLPANELKTSWVAAADPTNIRLQNQPLISMEDVLGYALETHTLQLTPEAARRLADLKVPVVGLPFVVTIKGEPIFTGAFWTSLSSLSFDESIVIDVLRPGGQDEVQLQLGYPESPDMFRGVDWREDPRLLEAFDQAGKLIDA